MEPNPFRYTGPVAVEDLLDRDDETRLLADLGEGGHHARLSAPRRYGKTSLLYRVRREVEHRGLRCAYVDLYGVVNRREVAARLRVAYEDLPGRWARAVRSGLRDLELSVATPVGGAGVRMGRSDPDGDAELLALLDLPKRLHARDGVRTVVLFDEFQDLLAAGDRVDALLRSRIQHHVHEGGYVFAGSHQGLMRELFETPDRPLFRQARPVPLAPLPSAVLAAGIEERFGRRRDPGPALTPLLRLAAGHPQRAMQLAHHLFAVTAPGQTASEEHWVRVVEAVFAEAGTELQEAWARLSLIERRVVTALASSSDPLLGRRTLERFELSKASASRARDKLIDDGVLSVEPGRQPYVTDPLLGAWVRAGRRSPAPPGDGGLP